MNANNEMTQMFAPSEQAGEQVAYQRQRGLETKNENAVQSATGKIAAAFGLQIATLQQQQNHNSNDISGSKTTHLNKTQLLKKVFC